MNKKTITSSDKGFSEFLAKRIVSIKDGKNKKILLDAIYFTPEDALRDFGNNNEQYQKHINDVSFLESRIFIALEQGENYNMIVSALNASDQEYSYEYKEETNDEIQMIIATKK